MSFMNSFFVGLLLSVAIIIPSSADSKRRNEYPVVSFTPDARETFEHNRNWRMCGDYFAEIGATDGKIVHFKFREKLFDKRSMRLMFARVEQINTPAINEKVATPLVMVLGEGLGMKFVFVMNKKDYDEAIPCLVKGVGI